MKKEKEQKRKEKLRVKAQQREELVHKDMVMTLSHERRDSPSHHTTHLPPTE